LRKAINFLVSVKEVAKPRVIHHLKITRLPNYRVNLVQALKEMGGQGVIKVVAPLLKSDLTDEKVAAEVCILEMKNKYIPDYIEGIKASDPYVRSVCIQALYKMKFKDPKYIEDIKLSLNDSNEIVREYATKILKENYKK